MPLPEKEERAILEAIRRGTAPTVIKRRASRGTIPVSTDELLEILVFLTQDPDPTCSEVAKETLTGWPPEKCAPLLADPLTSAETLAYFSRQPDPVEAVVNAVANHPHADDAALAPLTPRLSLEQIEQITGSEERLAEMPQLVAALLQRSDLPKTLHSRLKALHTDFSRQEKERADALAREEADTQTSSEDERARISLVQKITDMGISERVQFALKGDRETRMILIRDPNKVVYRAVLQSPRLSDSEIESFAGMKNVADEVLRIIASTRKFVKNYAVVRNLVNNPRTPLDVSLPFLNHLINKDLKFLGVNRNVAETLRTMAANLHQKRTTARKK